MFRSKLVIFTVIVVVLGLSIYLYSNGKKNKEPKYRLEKVERGDVTSTVTATGTLGAVTTVKVGSQVSGIISRLYVDFNSEVRKGQLIAELDPTTFQAQVEQRRADLERARIEANNSRTAYERAKRLVEIKLLAESEYDTAKAAFESTNAAVKQAEAALQQAMTSLSYTKILSPIDGTVVDRQYDIGQTVAASFQAPTLFTIAQDLALMQVSTNIDEADIGKIRAGEKAAFTVDAFPERPFEGKISQIRLSPQIVQNVVTYPVLIDVANPNLDLKPGMTANVSVPIDTRTNVLKIPNAALRFKPDPADTGTAQRSESRGAVVYILRADGKLEPVPVRTSLTDGNFTAFESIELKEGTEVVTGLITARAMDSTGGVGQQGTRRRW